MANTCPYTARLCGKKQDVIDFLWWLVGRGPLIYINKEVVRVPDPDSKSPIGTKRITRNLEPVKWEPGYVGRIGHWEAEVRYKKNKNDMLVEIDDYCAWSFLSSAIENDGDSFGDRKSVPDLCRIYDIQFEVFSEEPGQGFDEYFYFDGHELHEDDYVGYEDVRDEMRKDHWQIRDGSDTCRRRVVKNGKPHIEKRNYDEVFAEAKNKIFPHTFRHLCKKEWWESSSAPWLATRLDDFCKKNKNSWFISWQEYDRREKM